MAASILVLISLWDGGKMWGMERDLFGNGEEGWSQLTVIAARVFLIKASNCLGIWNSFAENRGFKPWGANEHEGKRADVDGNLVGIFKLEEISVKKAGCAGRDVTDARKSLASGGWRFALRKSAIPMVDDLAWEGIRIGNTGGSSSGVVTSLIRGLQVLSGEVCMGRLVIVYEVLLPA
jgi:hypothetical protein